MYASVMSTKRGPRRSSLGPDSGDADVRLMWSEMATISPGCSDGSTAPAALVTINVRTPSAATTRMPKPTSLGG